MNDKQKQFITILRLYNLSFVISSMAFAAVFFLYGMMFGFLGLAGSSSTEGSAEIAGVGGAFGLIFGCIGLFVLALGLLEGYMAWKLETPKKWIRVVQLILLGLRFFNIATLPLTIYFFIKLLSEEYKNYYVE